MENRKITILYASQTGNAQEVAEQIARQANCRHFKIHLSSMNEFDKSTLIDESLVLFTCSTTGQGQEPDQMKQFWKFLLRKSHPMDILNGIQIAVFGLGDSSYAKYNYPAKKLYKRLVQLGAKPLIELGLGDDQHYLGIDGTLDPWLSRLWETIMTEYPIPNGLEIIPDSILPPSSFTLEYTTMDEDLQYLNVKEFHQIRGRGEQIRGRVKKNKRITDINHFQDIRHIELEVENITYEPGDSVCITPKNTPDRVVKFIELLGWQDIAEKPFRVISNRSDIQIPHHWPRVTTISYLFTHILDIYAIPKRYFFFLLSFFTSSPQHAERLKELASPQGQQDYLQYCYRPKRTIYEVLQDFPVVIPLGYVFDLFKEMSCRYFSISSCVDVFPHQIHLTVGIVEYSTLLKTPRLGICSHWMSFLQVDEELEFTLVKGLVPLRSSTMNPPLSSTMSSSSSMSTTMINKSKIRPMLFIAPGTGIAPIRSLIQHRIYNREYENILIYGIRNKTQDYLYQLEWQEYVSQGFLQLFLACSRDQPDKIYVQDILLQIGQVVWDYLQRDCILFVCGNSKVPDGVDHSLLSIMKSFGKLNHDQSEEYLADLVKSRRYFKETW